MSMTYTKLFSTITTSTIWCEDSATRIVWITMLAMCDREGRVWGSVPGLANVAQVSVDECRAALEKFMQPDPDSRTEDHEGRRVAKIDGGWELLNHTKYTRLRNEAERRAYKTEKQREYRENQQQDDCPQWTNVDNVDRGRPIADSRYQIVDSTKDIDAPEGLNLEAWGDYVSHRKELRAKKLTARGQAMAMKKLAALSHEGQQTVVDKTIENGWIGVFPEKIIEKTKQGNSFDDRLASLRREAGIE